MKSKQDSAKKYTPDLHLEVRRQIAASPDQLFRYWTEPEYLKRWWGPQSVTCPEAQVDLRIDGRFRIANQFPDNRIIWIEGTFLEIERPLKLVYTWELRDKLNTTDSKSKLERVTVRFTANTLGTEVIVLHERIHNEAIRQDHKAGWLGCLDGLEVLANGN